MSEVVLYGEQLPVSEKANALMIQMREQKKIVEEYKENEKELKRVLMEEMKKRGIKNWSNDIVSVTYIPDSTVRKFNDIRAKEFLQMMGEDISKEGKYYYDEDRSESIRITFKKGSK